MAKLDPLDALRALYHFVDRRNLPSIREHGLYSLAKLREIGIEIAAPGGNDWSHEADERRGLDKYIHLCLRRNHPMEFRARERGQIERVIYLEISTEVLQIKGVKFTAAVSNQVGVKLRSLDEARELIDFDILYTGEDKRRSDIQQRLQKAEKCEILVPDHIPLDLIRNIPNG